MPKKVGLILIWLLAIAGIVTAGATHGSGHVWALLSPGGPINDKERKLMLEAVLLGMIVVIPVFVMLFGFAWRYREGGSKKAHYSPEFAGSRPLETIWWGVPLLIITVLSVLTAQSSHQLDPYKAIASTTSPMHIQVVALDWKWLFLYPDQHIATVNYLVVPTNTPLAFDITADAPMNSFWIPQLGGQIYAMSGMTTQLHLLASKTGNYYGSSANISGNGFAGMHFMTHAVGQADFRFWANSMRQGGPTLSQTTYRSLAQPSIDNPTFAYANYSPDLYNSIMRKYMAPTMNDSMGHGSMMMEMN